jgi:hypothetical protein
MDTTGLELTAVELSWRNGNSIQGKFVWKMDSIDPNNYRLTKVLFCPSESQPLASSGSDTSEVIFMVEIEYS